MKNKSLLIFTLALGAVLVGVIGYVKFNSDPTTATDTIYCMDSDSQAKYNMPPCKAFSGDATTRLQAIDTKLK